MIMAGSPDTNARRGRFNPWRVAAAWIAVVSALLIVFAAYRQPDMMLQMAQQLWSCF